MQAMLRQTNRPVFPKAQKFMLGGLGGVRVEYTPVISSTDLTLPQIEFFNDKTTTVVHWDKRKPH